MSIESEKAKNKWNSKGRFADEKKASWDNVPSRQDAEKIGCSAFSPNIEEACLSRIRQETLNKVKEHQKELKELGVSDATIDSSVKSLEDISMVKYTNTHYRGSLKQDYEKSIIDEFEKEKSCNLVVNEYKKKAAEEAAKKAAEEAAKKAEEEEAKKIAGEIAEKIAKINADKQNQLKNIKVALNPIDPNFQDEHVDLIGTIHGDGQPELA